MFEGAVHVNMAAMRGKTDKTEGLSGFYGIESGIASVGHCDLETVQDFLIKLGIKPRMHIVEISIFSLNHVSLTKIMNNFFKL